jgi:aryl-alcohol dehydrogenase
MEIKAAVIFKKSDKFKIEQLDLSDPRDDEVLVRIVAAGICHTYLAGASI